MLRNARNFFLLNISISDIFLCVLSMPLSLSDILNKFWILGPSMVRFQYFNPGNFSAVSPTEAWKSSRNSRIHRCCYYGYVFLTIYLELLKNMSIIVMKL